MDIASISAVLAPAGVISAAVIAAAVATWTTGRTMRATRHSAHVDRQLGALYEFLDIAADLGTLEWSSKDQNLGEKKVRLRAALQRVQVVAPPELQSAIDVVFQASGDKIAHGWWTKPYYEAEFKLRCNCLIGLIGVEGVLTHGAVTGPPPEGFDGPAAIEAFNAVKKLHEAQDQEGFPDGRRRLLAEAARTALEHLHLMTSLEQHLLLDGRGRRRETAMRLQFEEAGKRLEIARAALIVAANRWLLSKTSRADRRRGGDPVIRLFETPRVLPYGYEE
ncbi:hypothetical protein OG523_00940 [Streptomyces virginiae]|uniref:hypothetical protein n=1 Tax=Streptomyces virginiae TaxID=1961 RepID=UPI002E3297BA|nr:hypothetical protein [Streptomyces virginiae]